MTILDTPDYAKPLPGGSRTLIDTGFNLSVAGGVVTTGWFDVTSFNGLWVETNAFAFAGSFGKCEVQFQDVGLFQPIFPKWTATWRGDLPLRANVPILGAQARIQITGPADNANATLLVVGHGGGGSSSYRGPTGPLITPATLTQAPGASNILYAPQIVEGPATLVLQSDVVGAYANLRGQDASGGVYYLALAITDAATNGLTIPVWLPPAPVSIGVGNSSAATAHTTTSLILGRN